MSAQCPPETSSARQSDGWPDAHADQTHHANGEIVSKGNYTAWEVDERAFSRDLPDVEKLLHFARYALLAPSGHNAQPWRIRVHEDAIHLSAEPGRCLRHSGSLASEPDVSLGCWLEVLHLAALGLGYGLEVAHLEDGHSAALIRLGRECEPQPELLAAITARSSNRLPFDRAPLPPAVLRQFRADDDWRASPFLIERREDIEFVAECTARATRAIMSQKAFRAELATWVRSNVTSRSDGMPGFTQGMPLLPSLVAKWVVARIDIGKAQAKADAQRVSDSAALLIVQVHGHDKRAYLDAGRLYARTSVLAQSHGVASAGVAAAVVDPSTREEISRRFGLEHESLALIRLGYARDACRRTPRWSLERLLGSGG